MDQYYLDGDIHGIIEGYIRYGFYADGIIGNSHICGMVILYLKGNPYALEALHSYYRAQ